ncbi:MAG: 2-C-methyl-D-erythritol 2,4-cyclodiphosphate synthase [Methylophilaceae bacterium]|nr:2-C-methyl-D-erythritol 2,4-cyclodiphosphate synthase [Methylophilaceae bacterium]
MTSAMRIGHGLDAHAFAEGRRCILGGVDIAFARGLAGHSDADVLLHAICDALLGAASLGDIGQHFPSADPRYQNADSRVLLREVRIMLNVQGWRIVNIDSTLICEAPKLNAYLPLMRHNIAEDCALAVEAVSVKATTTDRMGFTGRGEGIVAEAVCLLETLMTKITC